MAETKMTNWHGWDAEMTMLGALERIAAMEGQTLISAEHGQPYSIGANAAFEQCAQIAAAAIDRAARGESSPRKGEG